MYWIIFFLSSFSHLSPRLRPGQPDADLSAPVRLALDLKPQLFAKEQPQPQVDVFKPDMAVVALLFKGAAQLGEALHHIREMEAVSLSNLY